MRKNKRVWVGLLSLVGPVLTTPAFGDESIRQPPSVAPLPLVAHVSIFDLDSPVVDPAISNRPTLFPQNAGQDQESIIRFRDPNTVLNAQVRPTFQASPLRFIHADDSAQEGESFPSGYLKEGERTNEPTPAKPENAIDPSLPSQGSAAANVGSEGEVVRFGDNRGLVESHAVPAEPQSASVEGIVPADVTDGVVVEGAGEPVSMPGDRGGCTRSCIP